MKNFPRERIRKQLASSPEEVAARLGVELRIGGEPVARHIIIGFRAEASRNPGARRTCIGHLPTGEHPLDGTPGGWDGDRRVQATERFAFREEVEPEP